MKKILIYLSMLIIVGSFMMTPTFAGNHVIDISYYHLVTTPGANDTAALPSNYEAYSSNSGWKLTNLKHLTLLEHGFLNVTPRHNKMIGSNYDGMEYFVLKTEKGKNGEKIEGNGRLDYTAFNGSDQYHYIYELDINGDPGKYDKKQESLNDFFVWLKDIF